MRHTRIRIQAAAVLGMALVLLATSPGPPTATSALAGGICIESCFIEALHCTSKEDRDSICQQYLGCGTEFPPLNSCDDCVVEGGEMEGFWCEAPNQH